MIAAGTGPVYNFNGYPVAAVTWASRNGMLGPDSRVVARDFVGNYVEARYGTDGGERCGRSAGEQEIASGNGQINIPVLKEATPLRSQYRRGFDGICCFFLILEARPAIRCGQRSR